MKVKKILVRFYTFDGSVEGIEAQIERLGEEIGLLEYALNKGTPAILSFEDAPLWAQTLTVAIMAKNGFNVGIVDPTIQGTVLTSGEFIPGMESEEEYYLGALR